MNTRIEEWRSNIVQCFFDWIEKEPIPEQVRFLQALQKKENHIYLIHAARGVGKTKTAAFYACYRIVLRKSPISIVVISGSQRQSEKLLEYCMEFLSKVPELQKDARERWPQSKDRVSWKDNSAIIALTAKSEKSLRSEHGTCLIYDEATGIDDNALDISRGILSTEDPEWKILYLSTPSIHGSHWFDALMKKSDKKVLKFCWTIDDAIWIDKELRELKKNEYRNTIYEKPELYGSSAVFHLDTKLTFPKELYKDNILTTSTYSGGKLIVGIDPSFLGESPQASHSALTLIEKLSDKFIVHACIDFTHCKTVEEQVMFVLEFCRDPLGIDIPVSEIKVDNGAAIFLAELSRHANCIGYSFKERSKFESRTIQFLSRTYFNLEKDESHSLSRYPDRAFNSTFLLLQQLRNYSPAWIQTHKHDLIDSLLLALYEPYSAMPVAIHGTDNKMDVLKECVEISKSRIPQKHTIKDKDWINYKSTDSKEEELAKRLRSKKIIEENN